ncbi:hypothetical protein ACLKA6_012330 [Drosophila palustris]
MPLTKVLANTSSWGTIGVLFPVGTLEEGSVEDFCRPLISNSQHAYRKGRSTETALHSVIATIEKSLSLKEYTLVAFLDIEGAFNNVFPEAITEALTGLGVEGRLVRLISQLLTSRAVTSALGSSTLTRYVSRGTLQGEVLSPLLWNIVVNQLLCDIEGGGCKIVAYADDVAVVFSGKYPQTLCDLMTAKLKRLDTWAEKCGLGVNPDKTELVLFSRRYKIPTLVPPKLKNSTLTFSESARYLGLVLDRKLNWNLNIQERFWWPALTKASTIKQLKKIQRMAEICITGALNTTPGEALDAILNITPIQQISIEISILSAIRLRDTNLWNEHPSGHSSILLNKNNLPPKTDYCMPIEHLTTPFRTLIPRREEWAVKPPGKPGSLTFYTDGSKLKNQAEILAIKEAIDILKISNVNSGSINIYSDSQAAIKSIAATTTNSISVSKCRKSLHEMAGHFDICLIWVPGHQDIPGNCIADELARIGTTNVLLPDKEDTSMPLATCKLMLHYQSNHKSTLRWQAILVGRVARQTWPKIDKARTVALCNLSRRNCSLVVRSLTGHWSCRDEEEEESQEHFFCSCPALSSRRLRTLGKPFLDSLGGLSAISPRKIALFIQLSNWIPF